MDNNDSLIKDFLKVFDQYLKQYGFAIESETMHRVALTNDSCKIIVTSGRFEVDIIISDHSEQHKFLLKTVLEALDQELDVDEYLKECQGEVGNRKQSELVCYATLFGKYASRVVTGNMAWKDVLAQDEQESYKIRTFINENFDPGHDLFYLMTSGKGWKQKVREYFKKNNIKM